MTASFANSHCAKCGASDWYARKDGGYKCAPCHRASAAKYRAAHPDKVLAGKARYRAAHYEQERASVAKWHRDNPERKRVAAAKWRRENPQRNRVSDARRRARKAGALGDVTAQQWQEVLGPGVCAYCGERKLMTVDHIVPLARGGEHHVDNIAAACKPCNSSKGTKLLHEWLAQRAAGRDQG